MVGVAEEQVGCEEDETMVVSKNKLQDLERQVTELKKAAGGQLGELETESEGLPCGGEVFPMFSEEEKLEEGA